MNFKWLEMWHQNEQRDLDFMNTDTENQVLVTKQGLML